MGVLHGQQVSGSLIAYENIKNTIKEGKYNKNCLEVLIENMWVVILLSI